MDEGIFESSPFTAEPTTNGAGKKNRGKRLVILLVILLLLGALIYGGIKAAGSVLNAPTPTPTPTLEPTPTEEPSPTPEESGTPTPTKKAAPTPTKGITTTPAASTDSVDKASGLDRADLTIAVQNGSGEAGVAKTMADKLTSLGYKVSGTANADNFDYTNTVIRVSSANSKFLALLKKDLSGTYTIDSSSAADYTGGDAVVIVGKN
jgi:cytoskeletal protein RodZ